MSPEIALTVAGALLVLTVILGVVLRRREGRRVDAGELRLHPADVSESARGSRATLVQFSTEMCTRCPHVRRMLHSYAEHHDGLRHVEVDLTHRPDLSARYKVLQTPTTFLVDDAGRVRARFHGVPHRHALTEALAAV
ncbi:thioredoxin family protein [Microbacterium aurantiacum]|uniref:thioredoxin family protein n=1 Tax=Microbacterium aurantiacum TaxID=162393 RepID=UPI000C805FA0|nr:thioredoxin family protein [Microbacterium aurantiacum]